MCIANQIKVRDCKSANSKRRTAEDTIHYKKHNYVAQAKGQLTVSREWKKHLRKYCKKQFWRKERKAGKRKVAKDGSISQSV